MNESWAMGIALVVIAGAMQGTFMLPTKYTTKWKWENMWMSYSVLAYLVLPWLIAYLTVPQLGQVLHQTSTRSWLVTFLFGLGWGLGALTWGLAIDALGLALGFAIILGLTASIGTLVPLLVLGKQLASGQTILIIVGVAVMLAGIVICAWAGKLKDGARQSDAPGVTSVHKSYALGLFLGIVSGVLSPFGNLGFAFGTEMTSVARRLNTPEQYAAIPFWAVIILPLFLCNATYCLYLLNRNRSFSCFRVQGTSRYHLLTGSMAVMWLVGMMVYGVGATKLGRIGPSIGWALLMSLVVVVANLWGVLTGEWRDTGRTPIRVMSAGLSVLVAAMFIIGLSNR